MRSKMPNTYAYKGLVYPFVVSGFRFTEVACMVHIFIIADMGSALNSYPQVSNYGYSHILYKYYPEQCSHHTNQEEFVYILEPYFLRYICYRMTQICSFSYCIIELSTGYLKGLSAISCISLISLLRFGIPDLEGLDLVLCLDITKYTTRGQRIPDISMPIISINVLYQYSYPQVYPHINLTDIF